MLHLSNWWRRTGFVAGLLAGGLIGLTFGGVFGSAQPAEAQTRTSLASLQAQVDNLTAEVAALQTDSLTTDSADQRYLKLTGGTVSGTLQVNAPVVANVFNGSGLGLTSVPAPSLFGIIPAANLGSTGVIPGTYTRMTATVDSLGRITSASSN